MKNILVTGAAGGMGQATVKALCAKGYRVFALDKNPGEPVAGAVSLCADITREESLRQAAQTVQQAGELFAVLHFAGLYMLDSLVEMPEEAFERIFRVNLVGAFLVNKVFLPLLRPGSRIMMVTSELAPLPPLPFTGIYAVSKAALDKYAYALCMELQLLGISVSVLRAGAVRTNMLPASTAQLERFCAETALYRCNAARFRQIVEKVEAKSLPPEKIAAKVCRILAAKHPAFAYAINRNPLLRLYGLAPSRLRLWAIRQILKG